ncbi:hypothetical protein PR048_002435 [Dryococelus australis]|uniref:Uncharacterized protein n=1 Tax=Dryococelus australis TaxID=614101 RepID=A0ABQ9IK99_9NEOP|nr:hypothetical protein PR048_002435 [Dryococelus australis]
MTSQVGACRTVYTGEGGTSLADTRARDQGGRRESGELAKSSLRGASRRVASVSGDEVTQLVDGHVFIHNVTPSFSVKCLALIQLGDMRANAQVSLVYLMSEPKGCRLPEAIYLVRNLETRGPLALSTRGLHGRDTTPTIGLKGIIFFLFFCYSKSDKEIIEANRCKTVRIERQIISARQLILMMWVWSSAGIQRRGNGRSPSKSTNQGIVRHDSHLQNSGVTRPGIEPGSPWWEACNLTAQSPWPLISQSFDNIALLEGLSHVDPEYNPVVLNTILLRKVGGDHQTSGQIADLDVKSQSPAISPLGQNARPHILQLAVPSLDFVHALYGLRVTAFNAHVMPQMRVCSSNSLTGIKQSHCTPSFKYLNCSVDGKSGTTGYRIGARHWPWPITMFLRHPAAILEATLILFVQHLGKLAYQVNAILLGATSGHLGRLSTSFDHHIRKLSPVFNAILVGTSYGHLGRLSTSFDRHFGKCRLTTVSVGSHLRPTIILDASVDGVSSVEDGTAKEPDALTSGVTTAVTGEGTTGTAKDIVVDVTDRDNPLSTMSASKLCYPS